MNKIDLRRIDLNLLLVFDVLMAECSVTRAAGRLGRTQSAVSHALARLREQLDDPLMVKSGGRMVPSPFAEGLVGEVRLVLSHVQRILVPPRAFEPASTTRHFRVAIPDFNDSIFPLLAARVRREAPHAVLEWVTRDERAAVAVAEGQIDLAVVPAVQTLPDGVAGSGRLPLSWASFVRQGHPAIKQWNKAAWSKWPHVSVRVGSPFASPVETAANRVAGKRQIAVWVPHFSAVAPLLAQTDLIATLPMLIMLDRLEHYGLRALKSPIKVEPMPHRLIWSARLAKDPGLCWLRDRVEQVLTEVIAAAEAARP